MITDTYHVGGFELVDRSNNVWSLENEDGTEFVGTFTETVLWAVLGLNCTTTEIDRAIQEMVKLDHNVAHFGRYGTFLFSSHREMEVERKAS